MDNQRTIDYVTLYKGNTAMCNNFPSCTDNSSAKEAGAASPPFPLFHGLIQVYNVALHFQDRCVKYTGQRSFCHTIWQVPEASFRKPLCFDITRRSAVRRKGLDPLAFNLYAPCVLFIGQAFRYSPENAFYIFNQQIYLII